jgi:hypothetical protein
VFSSLFIIIDNIIFKSYATDKYIYQFCIFINGGRMKRILAIGIIPSLFIVENIVKEGIRKE